MSQAPVQPNHRDAIQEFLAWFESAKVQGQVGPARTHSIDNYFIPFPKVSGFFKDSRQYRKILDALWPDTDIPIHPESVAQDYTTVFCILLCINKGHYIEKFARDDDLSDRKLPFTAMPSTFPISTPDEDFFGDFFRAQWHFCAPALKYRMERRFGPNHILPIVHKQPLGSGGSAQTFQIIVASAYDQLDPTTGDERAQNQRHAHTYALKTFHTRDAEEYYQNESRAYRLVAPHRSAGLLNYYGCFEHDGSYNLLLEFADEGTLEGYFEKHEPPQTAQDIYDFWCGMLGLAEAVLRIHSAGGEDSFDGWHQDVKPENILVVSGGRPNHNAFRFKLSDLGLSHFKKSKGKEAADGDTYGTRTYGAPECFRVDGVVGSLNISVKQNVDIWSLGCVWSEAAVWVISGKQGLCRYRANRTEATKNMEPFTDPGCFHDGTKVLDVVTNEHWERLNTKRKCDFVTKPVLDVVEDMLAANPDGRPTSKFLYEKTVKIRREAEIQVKRKGSRINSTSSISSRASSSLTTSILTSLEPPRSPPQFPSSAYSGSLSRKKSDDPKQHSRHIGRIGSSDSANKFCESPRTMTLDGDYHSPLRAIKEGDPPSNPPARPRGPNHGESVHITTPPVGTVATRRPPPPYLSVATALKWKNERKTYSSFGSFVRSGTIRQSSTIPHHHLFASLSTRDHVFLIDDAASMSNHWEDVKTLFGVLAYMVKRSDPDGVELRFTIGKGHYRSGKSSELVDKLIPVHPAGDSDIRMGLNSILSSYAQDTQKQNYGRNPWDKRKDSSPRRPLNLYVFTDGVWQPDCNVEESIRAFVKKFLQLNIPPGDIGIQFIRFGNDPAKKKLFDHLDSGLNLAMDIIDTEPHNGNVWKMLLGAINTWFDDDDGETRVDNGEGPSGPPA